MIRRSVLLSLAILITLSSAVPTGPAQVEGGEEGAAPEYFGVKLVNVTSYYGQERWKLNPGLYGSDPLGGLANASGQYDGAVGYRITLKVKLVNEDGTDINAADTELPFVNMSAYIDTPRGRIDGWVQRENSNPVPIPILSASPEFYLHFDMDGTNFETPGGGSIPGLPVGLQFVHVDITKGTTSANAVPAGSADLVFNYEIPAQDVHIGSQSGVFVSDVPDSMFRLFNDIGWGKTVRMVDRPVRSEDQVSVTYSFGATNATVRWYALAAERFCQPPQCVPNGRGTVEIHRREIDVKRTDLNGDVTFTAEATRLLELGTSSYESALVVVAAVLDPGADLGSPLTDTYAMGSSAIRTGAVELVVPISDNNARITGFNLNTTAYEEANAGGAPQEVQQLLLAANALEVLSYDEGGGSTSGDAIAILPNVPDSDVLSQGEVLPHNDPSLAQRYRNAQLLVQPIQRAHATNYRVVELLYGPGPSDFYGLAYADRGFLLTLSAPVTTVGEAGNVWANVTSVTTNYDLRLEEPGFDMRVLIHYNIPDLGVNETEILTLREGAMEQRAFTVNADRVADVRVEVQATSGDTLSDRLQVTARFIEPAQKKSLVDRIPGFEAVALLVGIAAVALLRMRTRA